MYNFNKENFLKVMNGAVGVKPEVDKIVEAVMKK